MSKKFDQVAEAYDRWVPPLPAQYIQLIQNIFKLRRDDKVIDLGCGSGLLTFPLAEFSSQVQGLDSSRELIRIARRRDVHKRVEWISNSVEDFDFGNETYKLIISYESFHLFPNTQEIIKTCASALKKDGYLCIGWCNYYWELPLRDLIIDVFAANGITWGEWGYQAFPEFEAVINCNGIGLSPVITKMIRVEEQINHVTEIASYLATIDKAASLSEKTRQRLEAELRIALQKGVPSDRLSGASTYFLAYSTKLMPR